MFVNHLVSLCRVIFFRRTSGKPWIGLDETGKNSTGGVGGGGGVSKLRYWWFIVVFYVFFTQTKNRYSACFVCSHTETSVVAGETIPSQGNHSQLRGSGGEWVGTSFQFRRFVIIRSVTWKRGLPHSPYPLQQQHALEFLFVWKRPRPRRLFWWNFFSYLVEYFRLTYWNKSPCTLCNGCGQTFQAYAQHI